MTEGTAATKQRTRKKWYRQEVQRARRLLSLGYEVEEVAAHLGRSPVSVSVALKQYGLTVSALRAEWQRDRKALLDLPPLPAFTMEAIFRPVEEDLPHLFQEKAVEEAKALLPAQCFESDMLQIPVVEEEAAVESDEVVEISDSEPLPPHVIPPFLKKKGAKDV